LRSRLRLRSPSSSRGRTHKLLRRASRSSEPSSHDQPRSGAEVVVGSRFTCGGGRGEPWRQRRSIFLPGGAASRRTRVAGANCHGLMRDRVHLLAGVARVLQQ
jgi:hypothetical protein